MSEISADELSQMQTDAQAFLPDSCVINRHTAGTSDGAGGYSGGSLVAAGTVACRVRPAGGAAEPEIAGMMRSISLWTITLPNGTDIRGTDQIVSNSVTYQIVGTPSVSSWEIVRRVSATVQS